MDRLAVGDTAVAERKAEAFTPAAEVEDFGDQGVLVHLYAGKSAWEPHDIGAQGGACCK